MGFGSRTKSALRCRHAPGRRRSANDQPRWSRSSVEENYGRRRGLLRLGRWRQDRYLGHWLQLFPSAPELHLVPNAKGQKEGRREERREKTRRQEGRRQRQERLCRRAEKRRQERRKEGREKIQGAGKRRPGNRH